MQRTIFKSIAVLVTVVMILCMFPTVYAEQNEAGGEEEMNLLRDLGIVCFDTSELRLNEGIQKSDYITMLINIIFDRQFKKYTSEVSQYAAGLGLIKNEYENVSGFTEQSDAVDMAVKLLGYYPLVNCTRAEYNKIRADLSKGFEPAGKYIRAGDAMKLVKRFMETGIFQLVVVSTKGLRYKIYKGETPLSVYRGIRRVEGLVDGTYETTLYGSSDLKNDEVSIGAVTYKTDVNTEDYIGQNVYAYIYFPENGEPNTLLHIEGHLNKILSLREESISRVSTDMRQMTYIDNNGKTLTATLSSTFKLIYNGVVLGNFTRKDLHPVYGSVTLIENNGDFEYDIVKVVDYKTVYVDYTSPSTKTVYNKLTYSGALPCVVLDIKDPETVLSITEKGSDIKFGDIQSDDILTVAMSKNTTGRKVVRAMVSQERTDGVITEIDKTLKTVSLDQTVYSMSDTLLEGDAEGDKYLKIPAAGTKIRLLLDVFGRVAAFADEAELSYNYGYIKAWGVTEGLDGILQMKIFDQEGRWVIMDFAEKITYNGERNIDSVELFNSYGENLTPQLVRYKLNSKNTVKELSFARNSNETSTDYFSSRTAMGIVYRSQNSSFNHEIFIGDKCTVWLIPQNPTEASETNFMIIDKSWLTSDLAYNIIAYDMDDFNSSNNIVIMPDDSYIQQRKINNTFVVERITTRMKEDETVAQCLTGFVENYVDFSAFVSDECDISNVKPGDFLQVFIDANGEVSRFLKYYSVDEGCLLPQIALSSIHTTNPIGYFSGTVLRVNPPEYRIMTEVDNNGAQLASKGSSTTRVTVCDTAYKTLRLVRGTYNDIEPGNKVFVALKNSTVRDVYVIK